MAIIEAIPIEKRERSVLRSSAANRAAATLVSLTSRIQMRPLLYSKLRVQLLNRS